MTDYLSRFFFDPGINCCGWAEFWGPELMGAGIFRTAEKEDASRALDLANQIYRHLGDQVFAEVVYETQQIYPGQKEDPNELLKCALVNGAMLKAVIGEKFLPVLPRDWTGGVPKKIRHKRLLKQGRLSEAERHLVDEIRPAGLAHNALDAVGLGLWYLRR